MKRFALFALIVVALLAAVELLLRSKGWHQLPTFRADERYEFFNAANQHKTVFGNLFSTNELGMRSAPVSSKKSKVLVMGDSVLDGGKRVGNDELASTLLENALNQATRGDSVQVLNVSCGGWGTGNAAAFLESHGHFGAKRLMLVFSSHDYADAMHFWPVVGVKANRPAENPTLATVAFVQQWLDEKPETVAKAASSSTPAQSIDSGWNALLAYATENELELTLCLHATQKEATSGQYEERGQRILAWCHNHQVPVVTDLGRIPASGFLDNIHLNASGQAALAEVLGKVSEVSPFVR